MNGTLHLQVHVPSRRRRRRLQQQHDDDDDDDDDDELDALRVRGWSWPEEEEM